MTVQVRTKGPQATQDLAAALAQLARRGDVIVLAGEMGAGKTCFAQGFARGLGIDEPVTSPTFTLVRTYHGRIDLVHADLYRLDREQEVIDLALHELVSDGVALVEWGDAVEHVLPPDVLEVRLAFTEGDDEERVVEITPTGRSWSARADQLRDLAAGVGGERR